MGVLARSLQKAGSVVQSLMGPARQIHAAPKIAPVNHLRDIYATTTYIYPLTTLHNTRELRTIKPPPNPTPLLPSTGHFPHRLPEPRPALDPAQVLTGGDVQPQLQIRKLGQDERARTRDRRGGKERSAMLAAPSTSSPRIASPASATSAFRYSNSSTTASPSTRNGKSASPALPSLRNQRDMTADTASNGVSGSPATTALGSSNSSQDLVDLKNLNMRRGSRDEALEASRPDESSKEGGANGEERTQGNSAGEGAGVRTAIDIQALLQSPTAKRRQDADPAKDEASRANPQLLPPKRPRAAQRAPKVLPLAYELVDVEDMVILVAGMVSELIQTNDNLPLRDVVLTRFHSRFVSPLPNHHDRTVANQYAQHTARHLSPRLPPTPRQARRPHPTPPPIHGLLHGPALLALPRLHNHNPNRAPLPHHRRHRRRKRPLRLLLEQHDVRACRRY